MDRHHDRLRLARLDHIRGLAAVGVMVFHLFRWIHGKLDAEDPLERVGIYAVSIFFMLSGLSLRYAYGGHLLASWRNVRSYAVKRVLRIFPLLWLTVLLTMAIWPASGSLRQVVLTITGLFGFVAWDQAIGTGVWSIGNELFFYTLLPLMLLLLARPIGRWTLGLVALACFIHATFLSLDPGHSFLGQWHAYSAPYHQLPYFVIGLLIPSLPAPPRPISPVLLRIGMLLCAILILFLPVQGDPVALVQGPVRVLFTLACALIVMCAWFDRAPLPRWIEVPLGSIGEACYPIYLLHPIVHFCVMAITGFISVRYFDIPDWSRIPVSCLATITIALVVHRRFEQYFIHMGKRITARPATSIS